MARTAAVLGAVWICWLPLLISRPSVPMLWLATLALLGAIAPLGVLLFVYGSVRRHALWVWPLVLMTQVATLIVVAGVVLWPRWQTELAPQEHTLAEIRRLGLALDAWARDQAPTGAERVDSGPVPALPSTVEPDSADAAANAAAYAAAFAVADHRQAEVLVVDADELAPVASADLREMLVPHYLSAWPAVDGWGHPFEVRQGTGSDGRALYLVRSAGSDGRFEDSAYPIGVFSRIEEASDIVWAGGLLWREPVGEADERSEDVPAAAPSRSSEVRDQTEPR
jgi:hypothetical protein